MRSSLSPLVRNLFCLLFVFAFVCLFVCIFFFFDLLFIIFPFQILCRLFLVDDLTMRALFHAYFAVSLALISISLSLSLSFHLASSCCYSYVDAKNASWGAGTTAGTTATLLIIDSNTVTVGWVGDSRVVCIVDDNVDAITSDHRFDESIEEYVHVFFCFFFFFFFFLFPSPLTLIND